MMSEKVIKKYEYFSIFGSNPGIFGRLCQRIDVRVGIDDSGIIVWKAFCYPIPQWGKKSISYKTFYVRLLLYNGDRFP